MATPSGSAHRLEYISDFTTNIIQKPSMLNLDWLDILEGQADSERCGVCGEVTQSNYFTFGKVDKEVLFVCSKKCLYYSWDNVVQLAKKRGMYR